MRSVDKGLSPTAYRHYRDAMPDLVGRLGWYCSYCEMPIANEPDVEHVHPKSLGGAPNSWANFLLGCKKCNKIKSTKNPDRNNYLWPDEDNTAVAFEYYNEIHVRKAGHLAAPFDQFAINTLSLTGIDRVPSRIANPSKKDKRDPRWQKRKEAWGRADRALANWHKNPTSAMSDQIAETAAATGFYSIWIQFFESEPTVLAAIKVKFPNTYDPVPNGTGGYVLRAGGRY